MFDKCFSLISLPNISEWNLENVNDISYMFSYCNSLVSLPNFTKLSTSNTIEVNGFQDGCFSSLFRPEFNNLKTSYENINEGIFEIFLFLNPLKAYIEYLQKEQEKQNFNIFDM